MSIQSDQRAAIVAAVNGVSADVDGATVTVTASLVRPAVTAPYQAWPVWTATRPVAMCVSELEWQLLVTLPGADAQTWTLTGDALVDELADALADWHLTRIEPGQLKVADGLVPVLVYTFDI
jgi:hypothetical protein